MKKNNNLNLVFLILGIVILILLIGAIFYFTYQLNLQKIKTNELSSELNVRTAELSNINNELINLIKTNNDLNNLLLTKEDFERNYQLSVAYINLADYQFNYSRDLLHNANYYNSLSYAIYDSYDDYIYDYDYHKDQLNESLNQANRCITNDIKAKQTIDQLDRITASVFLGKEIDLRIKQIENLSEICKAQKNLVNSELSRIYGLYELDNLTLANNELEKYNNQYVPAINSLMDEYVDIRRQLNIYWGSDIYEID